MVGVPTACPLKGRLPRWSWPRESNPSSHPYQGRVFPRLPGQHILLSPAFERDSNPHYRFSRRLPFGAARMPIPPPIMWLLEGSRRLDSNQRNTRVATGAFKPLRYVDVIYFFSSMLIRSFIGSVRSWSSASSRELGPRGRRMWSATASRIARLKIPTLIFITLSISAPRSELN